MTRLRNLYYILLQILFTTATLSTIIITYERAVGADIFRNTVGVVVSVAFFLPAIIFVLWMVFGDSKFFERRPLDMFFAVLNTSHVLTMFIRLFWVIQYAFIYGVQSVTTRQVLEVFIPDLRMAIMIIGIVTPILLIFLIPFYFSWRKLLEENKKLNYQHNKRQGRDYPNDKRPF